MSIKKAWRSWSVASKIILMFLCALVPVNVLLIYSTQSYMAALRFQMINSGRNVMELAMLRLDNQMDTMELYLYTQSTEDSDFIRVSMDEGDDFFLVSLHLSLIHISLRPRPAALGKSPGKIPTR